MTKPENNNIVERHGCIVCGKMFDVLAVYTPDHRLVDWTVTSSGGHRVRKEQHPLVACDAHSAEKIDEAYDRWKVETGEVVETEQEEE